MPTPPLSDAQKREALEAVAEHGSIAAAARALGIPENTFRHRFHLARRDPAISGAMQAVNTGLVPSVAWIKTKATDDAPGYSVMLRPGPEAPEAVAERIAARMKGIPAAPMIERPKQASADLMNFLPVFRSVREITGRHARCDCPCPAR